MEMGTYTIEDVTTLEQWRRAVALRNACNPYGPITVERAMNAAAAEPKEVPKRRLLLSKDGVDHVYCAIGQQYWSKNPDLYGFQIEFDHHVEGIDEAVELAEKTIREFSGKEASTWYRTDKDALRASLASRGYIEGQRNPVTSLDLNAFDPVPWMAGREKLVAQGYEFIDVATYADANPETWKRDLWRMEMDMFQDVPLPDPFVEVPFEDWVRDLDANPLRFDWQFFALFDGAPVAMVQLFANHVDPSIVHTGLTGVRREHRRRGLASALKGCVLERAKNAGVKKAYTDNEENNPMYSLNVAIGFKPEFEIVNMRRQL